ncbi:hypothetical protein ASZ90_001650 [hydrocarbon metagenome]|uniref:Uncharacterized protein n=1 Tax=hydrocarbon metagenome TaxID=938273 RepID=A0A0W8G5P4_9ZZZZ
MAPGLRPHGAEGRRIVGGTAPPHENERPGRTSRLRLIPRRKRVFSLPFCQAALPPPATQSPGPNKPGLCHSSGPGGLPVPAGSCRPFTPRPEAAESPRSLCHATAGRDRVHTSFANSSKNPQRFRTHVPGATRCRR